MQKVYAPEFVAKAIEKDQSDIRLRKTFTDEEAAAIRSMFKTRESLLAMDKSKIVAEAQSVTHGAIPAKIAALATAEIVPVIADCITWSCISIMDTNGVYRTTISKLFPDAPSFFLSVSTSPDILYWLPSIFARLDTMKESVKPFLKDEFPDFKPGDIPFKEFIAPMLPGFKRESKLSEPWPEDPAVFPMDVDTFSDEKAKKAAYDMVGIELDAEVARATLKQNIEALWARWRKQRDSFIKEHRAEIEEDMKTAPLLEKCGRYYIAHFVTSPNYKENPDLPMAPVETVTRVTEKMAMSRNMTTFRAPHAYAALQATKPDIWLQSMYAKEDNSNPSSLVEVKAAVPQQTVKVSFLPPKTGSNGGAFIQSKEYIAEHGVLSKYDEWVNAIFCTMYDRGLREISLTQLVRAILVDETANPTKHQKEEAINSVLLQEDCKVVIEISYKYDDDIDYDDDRPATRTIIGRYLPCKIEQILSKTGKALSVKFVLLDRPPVMEYSELSNNQIQTIPRELMSIRKTEKDSKGNTVLSKSHPAYSKNFISILWYTVRRYLDYEATTNTIRIDTLIKEAGIEIHQGTERVERARVVDSLRCIFDCWIVEGKLDSYKVNREGRNHKVVSVTFYVSPEHHKNAKALEGIDEP